MSIGDVWTKIGVDDWRGLIMLAAMVLVAVLVALGHESFAQMVFVSLVVLAGQYFFSKGQQEGP